METEPDHEFPEIDAQLARLPKWRPPPDFAVRLAAAAARENRGQVAAPSTLFWLWGRIVDHLPLATLAGMLGLMLATLPWSNPELSSTLPWLLGSSLAVSGLVLTVRLLRAP